MRCPRRNRFPLVSMPVGEQNQMTQMSGKSRLARCGQVQPEAGQSAAPGQPGRCAVKVRIQVIIESDDGHVQAVEEVACLKRGTLTPEELGLNLAEAKEILQSVQRSMAERQVGDYTAERINCPGCGQRRAQKGHHPIQFRTLFGKLTL